MGCPHPDHILPLLTSRQVTEWRAYFEGEDERRAEEERARMEVFGQRVGLICATIGTFSPISKRHDWKPADFVGETEAEKVAKKHTAAEKIKAFFGIAPKRKG